MMSTREVKKRRDDTLSAIFRKVTKQTLCFRNLLKDSGNGLTDAKFDVIGYSMYDNKYTRKKKEKKIDDIFSIFDMPSIYGTQPKIGGINARMNGHFEYRAGLFEYYDVRYWQPEEGIVLYDYTLKDLDDIDPKKVNNDIQVLLLLGLMLFTAGTIGAAGGSAGGLGAPLPA